MSRKSLSVISLLGALCALQGCGQKTDEAPPKISAAINNNAPEAKNAPSAQFDESPGELAGRMGGKGGMAKKMGLK